MHGHTSPLGMSEFRVNMSIKTSGLIPPGGICRCVPANAGSYAAIIALVEITSGPDARRASQDVRSPAATSRHYRALPLFSAQFQAC